MRSDAVASDLAVSVLVLDERADLALDALRDRFRFHLFGRADDALAGQRHLRPVAVLARLTDAGLELAAAIASEEPTLPVVLIAERPDAAGVCRAIRAGVRDVVDASDGAAAVARALEQVIAWRSALLQGVEARVTALRDALTARQRRIEALEERAGELAQQLAAETALVAQTQHHLEVERERALAAVRAKGRFLANVGHELHTPLNAIIGYAELLREELPAEAQVDADRIVGSARALLALLQEVLHLARLEAGQVHPVFEPVSVPDAVAACFDRVRGRAEGSELALGPVEVQQIVTDPARICELLVHLLDNGLKFARGGRVELSVRAEPGDDGPEVVFRVRDDGVGVRPEDRDRIFEAFTQADSSATREHGGAGLGLAVARQIARVLGGSLRVDSEPGSGAVFELRLPDVAVTTVEGQGQDLCVLVIDDDPVVRTLLQRMLLADGHAAITTGSGPEGLALARVHRPALIALDVRLPGDDGWSVLARILDDPALAAVPVVMLSADPPPDDALDRGARAFLQKPVDREALRAVVAAHARRDVPVGLAVGPLPSALDALARDGALCPVGLDGLEDALTTRRPPWLLVSPGLSLDDARRALALHDRHAAELPLISIDEGLSADERAFLGRTLHRLLPADAAAERIRAGLSVTP